MKSVSLICRLITTKMIRKIVYCLRLGSVCVTEVCRVARALPALMAQGGTTHTVIMLGVGVHDNRAAGTVRSEPGSGRASPGLGKTDRKDKMVCRTNRSDKTTAR